jgi:hypothetical protein
MLAKRKAPTQKDHYKEIVPSLQYFISSIPFYSFSFFLGSLCFCIQTKELLPIHLSPIIFLSVYIANSKTSNNNNNKALSHIYIPLVAGSHKPG